MTARKRRRRGTAGVLLVFATVLVACTKKAPPSTAKVTPQAGTLVSGPSTSSTRPSVVAGNDGKLWVAWLQWTSRGDEIWFSSRAAEDEWSPPRALTPAPASIVRPVLARGGSSVLCFWTATSPDRPAAIWWSRFEAGAWSAPARLAPEESRAHQNPEVATASDGSVAVAHQTHDGRHHRVDVRVWSPKGGFGPPLRLSSDSGNAWDPALAFDTRGVLHAVWSAYRNRDYDVVWSSVRGGRASAPRTLSDVSAYDLHPSLTASPDGSVWLAWDAIRITKHGNSGATTITGANLKDGMPDRTHGRAGAASKIEVRRLEGEKVFVSTGEELPTPGGFIIAHGALPRVGVGANGEPWLIHRALRRGGEKLDGAFWWEVIARPLGRPKEVLRVSDSAGYLEEVSTARGDAGVSIAYSSDRRQLGFPSPEALARSDGEKATRPGARPSGVHVVTLPKAGDPDPGRYASLAPEPRVAPPAPPVTHSVTLGGRTYHLLWGDTHRHSSVSRCSEGGEPGPDDLMRYGIDVDRYDWMTISDHRVDMTPENWWKNGKIAELYDVPGSFSVLYNFEWELPFPEGHHNMIFARRPELEIDSRLDSLASGWALLDKRRLAAITIAHTTADARMGTDFSTHDERYRRLIEVFQACRGSYEHEGCPRQFFRTGNPSGFYWKALEKGHHVGAIASSDHGFGVSYACVYAEENTRQAVFDALWARRAYGATSYGIVLDVRSGSHFMGEVWSQPEPPELEIQVRGSAPLRSVEVIGRSRVLRAWGDVDHPLGESEAKLRFVDEDWRALTGEQWYYVRVIQTDDEMAWSSPVWVSR